MDTLDELRQLVATGHSATMHYAIDRYEKAGLSDPALLLQAIPAADEPLMRRILPLLLNRLGTQAGPTLVQLLQTGSPLLRRLIVEHLEPTVGGPVRPALEKLLGGESDVFVLASAVRAAGRLGLAPETMLPLLTHADERVRANTVAALAGVHRPDVGEALVPLLKDGSLRVQGEAFRALGRRIPGPELRRFVMQRLQCQDRRVRAATAVLVADLPLADRVGLLAPLLEDREAVVVGCAIRSLGRLLPDPTVIGVLVSALVKLEDDRAAATAVATLAGIDARLLPTWLQQLLPPDRLHEPGAGRLMALAARIRHNWELLLPWIMAGLRAAGPAIRLAALQVVLARIDGFKSDLRPALEPAERVGGPVEQALAARIRWAAGQVDALGRLEQMLTGADPALRAAAADQLRAIPNLLARRILSKHRIDPSAPPPTPAPMPGPVAPDSTADGPPVHLGDLLPPDGS